MQLMEQHEKLLKIRFEREHDDAVIHKLKELANDVNARSLKVFKKADSIARTTSDMELFLKSREIYENNRCNTERIKQFGDKS